MATATRRDTILSKVYSYVQKGWPQTVTDGEKPYWRRTKELSTESGCLLWGNRVIIPGQLRSKLIEELHQDHPGIARMKSIARSYFWWPSLDRELEEKAQSCVACQSVKNSPPSAPLHPWLWPAKPWQRVHNDFAGPFMNRTFLVVVDAHSKWPEVIEMHSTTAQKTITELRKLFAAYGLPEQIVSDNGPQFVSDKFATFVKMNGIKHIRCAPYHPSSNGAAERFVQTFKKAMKANRESSLSFSHRLTNFLFTYRYTSHATTNEPPCQLFMGRMIRKRLDLLYPKADKKVNEHQASQKANHDKKARQRNVQVGQRVLVRDQDPSKPWVPGIVEKVQGPLTYLIRLDSGQLWRRHIDHVKQIGESSTGDTPSITEDTEMLSFPLPDSSDTTTVPEVSPDTVPTTSSSTAPPVDSQRRYPVRI